MFSSHRRKLSSLFACAPEAGFDGGLILSLSWQLCPRLPRHSPSLLCPFPPCHCKLKPPRPVFKINASVSNDSNSPPGLFARYLLSSCLAVFRSKLKGRFQLEQSRPREKRYFCSPAALDNWEGQWDGN